MKIKYVGIYKGSTAMVEFENGETKFINNSVANAFNLTSGMEIPESAWKQVELEEEYRKAKERALYLLDYKDYSYMDLYKKLEQNYSEDTCFRVLDKLSQMDCINDRRYAANLARHYCEVKKFGRYRAFQEMRRKGLTDGVINDALDEYDEGEFDRLVEVIQKKIPSYINKENGITKLKNYLIRQGYSYSQIKEALSLF